MSIIAKTFSFTLKIVVITLFSQIAVSGADIAISIKVSPATQSVEIEGELNPKSSTNKRNWSFIKSYAGAEGLASRISGFRLLDENRGNLKVKRFAIGEYLADREASVFLYRLDLSAPRNVDHSAHVSWLTEDFGVLMLGDMLPEFADESYSARVTFYLPEGWKISGGNSKTKVDAREFEKMGDAVILVGKEWREKEVKIQGSTLSLSIRGNWQFDDDQALTISSNILKEYSRLFGSIPRKRLQIGILPFPSEVGFERWRAETRGANITVCSSLSTFKSLGIQRLKEQLRHEILHLWFPNGISLTGEYGWFYEGFGVYQALKTGVWLGQIRFEDFLNTLSDAYRLNQRRSRKISLVNVSGMRWEGAGASVYALGMLAGFACDLEILKASKSKRELSDILRKTFSRHSLSTPGKEANQAVLAVLRNHPELDYIIERNISGSEQINWGKHLGSSGIELDENRGRFVLRNGGPKGRRQKALLEKLGYNRWRKFTKKSINRLK